MCKPNNVTQRLSGLHEVLIQSCSIRVTDYCSTVEKEALSSSHLLVAYLGENT